MSQYQILSFLQGNSVEILVMATIVCIITNIIKKFIPLKLKNIISLLPFVLGICLYAIYSFIFNGYINQETLISKGVQVGAVSTIIYAVVKQLINNNRSTREIVTAIIKGIVSSNSVKKVTELILNGLSGKEEDSSEIIAKIICENSAADENESLSISKFIIKTVNELTEKGGE